MERKEKDAVIARWRPVVCDAAGVVVLEHQGLHGLKTAGLRATVRGLGARLLVVKRRLARRMVDGTSRAALAEVFRHGTALLLLPREWHPALADFLRYLGQTFEVSTEWRERKFYKRSNNLGAGKIVPVGWSTPGPHLVVRGGWLAGAVRTADEVHALAALPSREAVLAECVALIEWPGRALVTTLGTPAASLVASLHGRYGSA
jgi:ribosomal protein L10